MSVNCEQAAGVGVGVGVGVTPVPPMPPQPCKPSVDSSATAVAAPSLIKSRRVRCVIGFWELDAVWRRARRTAFALDGNLVMLRGGPAGRVSEAATLMFRN